MHTFAYKDSSCKKQRNKLVIPGAHLIRSNISGLVDSLPSILFLMAATMEFVLSSVPCLADFSAAPGENG